MTSDESGCGEALERLYLLLDQEADETTCEQIQEHLNACSECLDEYDLEVLVKSMVWRSCREQAPEPLRQRVLYSIRTIQVQVGQYPEI